MKFEEVLREGKKIKRKCWKSDYSKENNIENMSLYMSAILENDWEIVEEPKPPKLLAPAMYLTGTSGEWILGRVLFESEEEAKEYHGKRGVIWPAIPNKDGMYEVQG
jgi:hypothetical protein